MTDCNLHKKLTLPDINMKEAEMIIVNTKYGKISGIEEDGGIHAFLGVPYAKPPVGELRFRPPQEMDTWKCVRECSKYGAPSLQLVTDNHVTTAKKLKISSEDCLYLNIRTNAPLTAAGSSLTTAPADKQECSKQAATESELHTIDRTAKLPVYVFIHGGSYETGGGNMRQYEGQAFARDGVVYVNINYRLGPFGAFALETLREESGVTGCLQILDAAQAIKWIYENIEAFGGDPDNITIGGESAGAFTVSVLMCMPELKGMFRRCILESGSIRTCATSVFYGHGNKSRSVENSRRVAAALGCEDTQDGVEKLRNIPAEEILYKWYFKEDGTPRGYRSNPVLDGLLFDGDLVPDPRVQKPNAVDLLFGFNTDEGSMFADPALTEEQYISELQRMFPERWREVMEKYPVDLENTPYQRIADIYGLQKFKGAMLPYADVLSEKGHSVYAYHFDYMTERLKREGLGVRHIAELPFVFECFLNVVGADDEKGEATARMIHDAWVSFIKTGDPDINSWERYTPQLREALRITAEGTEFGKIDRLDEMLWLDDICNVE